MFQSSKTREPISTSLQIPVYLPSTTRSGQIGEPVRSEEEHLDLQQPFEPRVVDGEGMEDPEAGSRGGSGGRRKGR